MFSAKKNFTPDLGSEAKHFRNDLNLLAKRSVDQIFIYSEDDMGLDSLHVLLGNETRELGKNGKFKIEVIGNADHIFTPLWAQEYLIKIILNWTQGFVGS